MNWTGFFVEIGISAGMLLLTWFCVDAFANKKEAHLHKKRKTIVVSLLIAIFCLSCIDAYYRNKTNTINPVISLAPPENTSITNPIIKYKNMDTASFEAWIENEAKGSIAKNIRVSWAGAIKENRHYKLVQRIDKNLLNEAQTINDEIKYRIGFNIINASKERDTNYIFLKIKFTNSDGDEQEPYRNIFRCNKNSDKVISLMQSDYDAISIFLKQQKIW